MLGRRAGGRRIATIAPSRRGQRKLTTLGLIMIILGVFAGVALADAADPVQPMSANVIINDDGSTTITVIGGWQWTTHTSDCNTNRSAVGWAMDWNDPH